MPRGYQLKEVPEPSRGEPGQDLGRVDVRYRYGAKVTSVKETPAAPEWSSWIEELDLDEATKEILRDGWEWDWIELGAGMKELSSELLNERTDEELLSLEGMTLSRLRAVRRAVLNDPGVAAVGAIVEIRPVP